MKDETLTSSKGYQASETLIDGSPVLIRELRQQDRDNLLTVWEHLSPISRYYRFLSPKVRLSKAELDYFTDIDFITHVGLIAFVSNNGESEPVATGSYFLTEHEREAEVAFVVDDPYQGLGIGSLLLKHLCTIGRERHVEAFLAYVLTENLKMIEVFENSGLSIEKTREDSGLWKIWLSLN